MQPIIVQIHRKLNTFLHLLQESINSPILRNQHLVKLLNVRTSTL